MNISHLAIKCLRLHFPCDIPLQGLQNPSNTVLNLRAQCLPYMESSDLKIRKALSSECNKVLQGFYENL